MPWRRVVMDMTELEFGLNSFGEVATDGGRILSDGGDAAAARRRGAARRVVGLDVFSVGEHYREGHMDSATPVLLAAAAQATSTIGLGSSVTVLSTQDPVRLYQEFATVDGLSDGRAQLILGRASAIESFPLFGYDIAEYERIFEEKLDLFLRLMREDNVTWSGSYRRPARERAPASAYARGRHPGMDRDRRQPRLRHPRRRERTALDDGDHRRTTRALSPATPGSTCVRWSSSGGRNSRSGSTRSASSPTTDDEAKNVHWKHWEPVVTQMSKERGFYAPTLERYEEEVDTGALYVGSPETVAHKLAAAVRSNHLSRFDLKYDLMHLPKDVR